MQDMAYLGCLAEYNKIWTYEGTFFGITGYFRKKQKQHILHFDPKEKQTYNVH